MQEESCIVNVQFRVIFSFECIIPISANENYMHAPREEPYPSAILIMKKEVKIKELQSCCLKSLLLWPTLLLEFLGGQALLHTNDYTLFHSSVLWGKGE